MRYINDIFKAPVSCSIVMVALFLLVADSLMHRAAAAEMLFVLETNKKSEALKLIEDSTNNLAPT